MKFRSGQSLLEVTIAVLISAITATGIFSVILSTRFSRAKADIRETAAIIFRSAQEYLKPYVSVAPNSDFLPQQFIFGEAPNQWALADGKHNMNFLLINMPQVYGSTLTYTVATADCIAGVTAQTLECRNVKFELEIPE